MQMSVDEFQTVHHMLNFFNAADPNVITPSITPKECALSIAHLEKAIKKEWAEFTGQGCKSGAALLCRANVLLQRHADDAVGDERLEQSQKYMCSEHVPVDAVFTEQGTMVVCWKKHSNQSVAPGVILESATVLGEAIGLWSPIRLCEQCPPVESLVKDIAWGMHLVDLSRTLGLAEGLDKAFAKAIPNAAADGITSLRYSRVLSESMHAVASFIDLAVKTMRERLVDAAYHGLDALAALKAKFKDMGGAVNDDVWGVLAAVVDHLETSAEARSEIVRALQCLAALGKARLPHTHEAALEQYAACTTADVGPDNTSLGIALKFSEVCDRIDELHLESLSPFGPWEETPGITYVQTGTDANKFAEHTWNTRTFEHLGRLPAHFLGDPIVVGIRTYCSECKTVAEVAFMASLELDAMIGLGAICGDGSATKSLTLQDLVKCEAFESVIPLITTRCLDQTTSWKFRPEITLDLLKRLCRSAPQPAEYFRSWCAYVTEPLSHVDLFLYGDVLASVYRLCACSVYMHQFTDGTAEVVKDNSIAKDFVQVNALAIAAGSAAMAQATELRGSGRGFQPAIPLDSLLQFAKAVLAVNAGVVTTAIETAVDAVSLLAEGLRTSLPNVQTFTSPTYLPELAKRSLLQKKVRDALNSQDEALDCQCQSLGVALSQLRPGKTPEDIVEEFPKVGACQRISESSHEVVLLTAIVSALNDKPSEARTTDLQFLLTASANVPQTVRAAAEAACKVLVPPVPARKRQRKE